MLQCRLDTSHVSTAVGGILYRGGDEIVLYSGQHHKRFAVNNVYRVHVFSFKTNRIRKAKQNSDPIYAEFGSNVYELNGRCYEPPERQLLYLTRGSRVVGFTCVPAAGERVSSVSGIGWAYRDVMQSRGDREICFALWTAVPVACRVVCQADGNSVVTPNFPYKRPALDEAADPILGHNEKNTAAFGRRAADGEVYSVRFTAVAFKLIRHRLRGAAGSPGTFDRQEFVVPRSDDKYYTLVSDVDVSPDGRTVAVASFSRGKMLSAWENEVCLYDMVADSLVLRVRYAIPAGYIAFAPDGLTLALASAVNATREFGAEEGDVYTDVFTVIDL